MKTIWIATIPEIFGYGLIVIEETEEKALKALKKAFYEWRNARGSTTPFNEAFEWWGGRTEEITIGKVYNDDFH